MNNIVFIEGVSGVGKTTATRLLCDKLQSKGCRTSCYLEGSHDNPLDPFNGAYPPPISLELFSEIYLQYWQNFVKNQSAKDFVLILDGTFFHHQINDSIREYNATDNIIINHLAGLIHAIQQFRPVVFLFIVQ